MSDHAPYALGAPTEHDTNDRDCAAPL